MLKLTVNDVLCCGILIRSDWATKLLLSVRRYKSAWFPSGSTSSTCVPMLFFPFSPIWIILWSDAERYCVSGKCVQCRLELAIQFHLKVLKSECRSAAVTHNVRLYKIHRWRTDETADELVCRLVIECSRIGDLLDFPLIENDDLISHRHRFNLVVRDVDDSSVESVVQPTDLHPHLYTQLRIKIAQRFIE